MNQLAKMLCFGIADALVRLDAAEGCEEAEAAVVESLDVHCRRIAPLMPSDEVAVVVTVGWQPVVFTLSRDGGGQVMAERVEAVMPWQVPWKDCDGGDLRADPLATAMAVADMNRAPSVEDWPC